MMVVLVVVDYEGSFGLWVGCKMQAEWSRRFSALGDEVLGTGDQWRGPLGRWLLAGDLTGACSAAAKRRGQRHGSPASRHCCTASDGLGGGTGPFQ